MYYIGASSELGCFIIGQTQYSQYFRAENHFKNAVGRLGIDTEKFNYFEIFSFPGEEEKFQDRIRELNKKNYFPLNRSYKYLSLIYSLNNGLDIFQIIDSNFEKIEKKEPLKSQKKPYGEYKRVLLTEKQFEKLCEEFTEEVVLKTINYLDEYIESNNNKNHYTNYYIVMKRAIREDWYKIRDQFEKTKNKAKNEPVKEVPEEVKDFLNNIK